MTKEVNWKLLSVFAFLGLVACIFVLIFMGSLFANGPVTVCVQIAAVILMAWARITFGMRSFHAEANPTAGGLVTHGPYRYFRHPIYAAILYFMWAGIAAHFSIRTVLIGLAGSAMLGLRMRGEEVLLERAYPEYGGYRSRTARVLPFVL